MTGILMAAATFLVVNIFVGLLRILRGPTHVDRLLAAQLFGTLGIAATLLLAEATGIVGALDVALIFALLAALAAVFFVRRFRFTPPPED